MLQREDGKHVFALHREGTTRDKQTAAVHSTQLNEACTSRLDRVSPALSKQ